MTDLKTKLSDFGQGFSVSSDCENFSQVLALAADYRGDITLKLKDGKKLVGYLFNCDSKELTFFPQQGDKVTVAVSDLAQLEITGKDTAEGKSWEAWVAKKKTEKNA